MKSLLRNKSLVTIVLFAACAAIIIYAYNYRVNKAIQAVQVPVATRTLYGREQITANDFTTVKVASAMITNNVIRNISDIEDKYVNYNTIIPEGSLFYSKSVVDWSVMPDSTWASINNDNTIVSIAVDSQSTFGNSIYPNDNIDLYYRNTNADGELFVGKLIEGIKVLAVKDKNGEHIFRRSSNQTDSSQLIFSVPEDLHLLLRKAMYVPGGQIFPVPRNLNYSKEAGPTVVKSDYIRSFILAKCWDLKPDYIESNNITNTTPSGNNTNNNTNNSNNTNNNNGGL